jgi:hypothetical protein
MVQRGAADSKQFTYGGYSKQGRKMRGGDAIKWLFSRELPLFACTVDRPKAQVRLYSTSAMWLVPCQFDRERAEIELCTRGDRDRAGQADWTLRTRGTLFGPSYVASG